MIGSFQTLGNVDLCFPCGHPLGKYLTESGEASKPGKTRQKSIATIPSRKSRIRLTDKHRQSSESRSVDRGKNTPVFDS